MIATITDDKQSNQHQIFIACLITGSLFAVHPLHVESVIWAAERKDLLSSLFFLLSIIFYIGRHTKRINCKEYIPFVFYCCSLFTKPMAVTLPIVIIILDIYPLQRITSASLTRRFQICFIEKLHYFIAAVAVAAITLISQGIIEIEQPPLTDKIMIVVSAVQHYLISFFYPFNLSPYYPVEILNTTSRSFLYLVCFFCIFILGLVIKKQKVLLLIIFFFLIILLPVIGIIKVGDHIYADRYTYLSMIGFYMLAGWLASEIIKNKSSLCRIIVFSLMLFVMITLAYNTHQYKNIWRSDLSLWEYVVRKYPNVSSTAHQNLGNSYYEHNMYREALDQYTYATDLNIHNLSACSNLALVYHKLGAIEKSLNIHEQCVINNPDSPWSHVQAGDAFYSNKQYKRAFEYYNNSINIEPNYPYGLLRLGKLFIQLGDFEQAIHILESLPPNSYVAPEADLLLVQAYANKNIDLDNIIRMK
jgi:Tfp pilus assembly protein PilF